MAIFGTPTVIGTLTSSTSSTSYVVPITATSTTLGDCIVVVVSSAGAGVNNTPSSVTDSENTGLQYQQVTTTAGSGQLTYLRLYNSKVLTNTDTVTVNFPSANTFLKSIAVIDCPGALADDLLSVAVNSGSSTSPSISTNLGFSYELVIVAQNNGNLGGAPSGFSPLTNLVTLHSGSSVFTSVSYQIVTSSGPYTAADTISSSGWSIVSAGMINTVPLFFNQNPYPPNSFYPSLSFNPSLQWARQPIPQPAIPTVISSAPVNIQCAQSNVFNGINFLSGNNANFTNTVGNWTPGGNTTQLQTNAVSHNATGAIQLTATGTGTLTASSSTALKSSVNGLPVSAGDSVFGALWFLAAATPRSVQTGIGFFDQNGNQLGSTSFGSSSSDLTSTWVLVTTTQTAPAGSYYARLTAQVSSVTATEVHYLSDAWLFDITSGSGMADQIQIFTPTMQQFPFAPSGIPYPLSLNSSLQYLPRQTQTAPFTVFQPGATGIVSSASPAGTPTVLQTFVPQFPWQQNMPGLRFVPAINWMKQQFSTSNAPTYVDIGQASAVTVTAQFPDVAVTISVATAVSGISVSVPTLPTVVNEPTATVTVTTPIPTIVNSVPGATANSHVSSLPATINENLQGTVATVNSSSTGQKVTISPVVTSSQVNAVAQPGSLIVSVAVSTANSSVASSVIATVSVLETTSNTSVSAPGGSIKETVIGTTSQVTANSFGSVNVSVSVATANILVSAPPAAVVTGKFVAVVTSNVAVSSLVNARIFIQGVTGTITSSVPAIGVPLNIAVPVSRVSVVAQPGFAGQISVTGTLINSDLSLDQLLSRQGKLLTIPSDNELVSETPSPLPQGI